jgi:acyl carrier protein
MKDLIIVNGQNHYPEDLEYTVQTSAPALSAMGSVAVLIERGGRECLALVQEIQEPERHVIDALGRTIHRSLLERHGVQVQSIAFVGRGSLPRTTSGKVQRYLVRIALTEGKLDVVHLWARDEQSLAARYVAPRTPIEESLAEIWSRVLGVERVGIDDNFFELGGQSLAAGRVAARIFEDLGVELAVRTVFEAPTVKELAEYIVSDTVEKLRAVAASGASTLPSTKDAEW